MFDSLRKIIKCKQTPEIPDSTPVKKVPYVTFNKLNPNCLPQYILRGIKHFSKYEVNEIFHITQDQYKKKKNKHKKKTIIVAIGKIEESTCFLYDTRQLKLYQGVQFDEETRWSFSRYIKKEELDSLMEDVVNGTL